MFSFFRGIGTSGAADDTAAPAPVAVPPPEHLPGGAPGAAACAADMLQVRHDPDPVIVIDFAAGGNSEEYLTFGWSPAETDFTWTSGDASGLRVRLPDRVSGGRCVVSVAMVNAAPRGEPPGQLVYVLADRIFVGRAVLDGPATFEFVLPPSACPPGAWLTITFLLPTARRPSLAPKAGDDRWLALAVAAIDIFDHPSAASLAPADLPHLDLLVTPRPRDDAEMVLPAAAASERLPAAPDPLPPAGGELAEILNLSFTISGNAEPYLGDGWSGAEDEFTWTEDDDSLVYIPRPSGSGPFMLRLAYGACVTPARPFQRLGVYLNETCIGTLEVGEDGPDECEFVLEPGAFGTLSIATLRLHHPDAMRPIEHFDSDDTRRLAFAFRSIVLLNAAR